MTLAQATRVVKKIRAMPGVATALYTSQDGYLHVQLLPNFTDAQRQAVVLALAKAAAYKKKR